MSSTAGAFDRSRDAGGHQACQRPMVAALHWISLSLIVGLAVVVLWRRLIGAFDQPLSDPAIVAVALFGAAAVFCFRQLTEAAEHNPARVNARARVVLFLLPTLSLLALLAALSIPGSSVFGLLLAWFAVIAVEAAQWLEFIARRSDRHTMPSPAPQLAPSALPPPPEMDDAEPAEAEIPLGLIQQVTRVVKGNGESIHALVRAHVPPLDRMAVVHLAFCPPLTERPELTAHAIDQDDADVRVTQAETFGARLEVRLAATADSARELLVEVLGAAAKEKPE